MFSNANCKTKFSSSVQNCLVKGFFLMNSDISFQFLGVISKETIKCPYFSTGFTKTNLTT